MTTIGITMIRGYPLISGRAREGFFDGWRKQGSGDR
jgi:hypothetical protein